MSVLTVSEQDRILLANKRARVIFEECLMDSPLGAPGREYLKSRGLDGVIFRRLQVGYAPREWRYLHDRILREGWGMDDFVLAGLIAPSGEKEPYDYFRDRIMVPLWSRRGGFAGRCLDKNNPLVEWMFSPRKYVRDFTAAEGKHFGTTALKRSLSL